MSRIVRIVPRMLLGGVEQHILQLFAQGCGDALVIPGGGGTAAELARAHVPVTEVGRPRLAPAVRASRGADIAHVHVINNDLVVGLVARLCGARRIVLTVHNHLDPAYAMWADHTFVVGPELLDTLPVPTRSSLLPEGIDVPAVLPEHPPLDGRPLRIVEVRRPDKAMAFTLGELVAAGALDGVDFEARVVGMTGASGHPRITHVGEVADPTPHYAWADLCLHGSALDTFGRVVYEALSQGVLPLATPIPAFERPLTDGEQVLLADGLTPAHGVALLRRAVQLAHTPGALETLRPRNHAWVQQHASTPVMMAALQSGYQAIEQRPAAPRDIVPDDVPDTVLDDFGELVDSLTHRGPLDPRRLDRLPVRPRGLAFWLLAESGRLAAPQRLKVLVAAQKILGMRPGLLRAIASELREQGHNDAAKGILRQAIRADPPVVLPHLELTDLLLRSGDRDGARAALTELLDVVPGYAPAERFLERIGQPPRKSAPTLFQRLNTFSRIIVTGPHRSGTTIAVEMIARDTGYEAILEESFDFYDEHKLRDLLRRKGIVVQCPALFDLMPDLSDSHTGIVLMRRPLDELARSRNRMYSPATGQKLSPEEQNTEQLARLGRSEGDAAAIKYELWQTWVDNQQIHNPIVIDYARLADHPLWVSKEERRALGKRWHNRRTST